MTKLTEEMILCKAKKSDLSQVKKLNCWGGGLTDVSIFMMMPNLELLALSVNNLESLSDLKGCRNLQELYLRKNNIKDLREVCHLKNLKHLKNLWLADNPCAETDSYRLSVLRTLPQLQVLDDVQVQKHELQEAFAKGKELKLPDEDSDENSPPSQAKPNQELDIPEEVQVTPKNDAARVLIDADNSKEILLQSSTVSISTTQSDISRDAQESLKIDSIRPTNDITPKETLPQVSTMFISPGQVRPKRLQEPEELKSRPQNTIPDEGVPLRKSSSPSKSKNLQISQDISSWRQSLAELHPELQDQECGALNEQTIERVAELQGCDSRYQHANARSCPIHNAALPRPQSRQQQQLSSQQLDLYHSDSYQQTTQQSSQRQYPLDVPYYQRPLMYEYESPNGRFGEIVNQNTFSSPRSRLSNRSSWAEGQHFSPSSVTMDNWERNEQLPYDRCPPRYQMPHDLRFVNLPPRKQYTTKRASNTLTAARYLVKDMTLAELDHLEMDIMERRDELLSSLS